MPREPSPACSAGGESPSAGACLQGDEPMRRCPQVLLILGLCLSVPAAAHAAGAPTPIDECSSARPVADFFALRARCQAKAAAERAAATPTGAAVTPAAQSVFAARNTVASLNFSNVPTWTDAGVSWTFHVVPIVKNSAGQPIVFDAALSPCRPLPYKDWLALLVDSMSSYDDIGSGNGVTLADSWAFTPDSPVAGETPHKWETRALNDETFLVTEEWLTQSQLGRDPNVVLGATPPWSGYACLSTFPVDQFTVLSSTGTRTLTATCPFATVNVGGGYDIDPGVRVSKDARNGNGWDVTGTNSGTGFGSLSSEAICLQGAPSNASLATVKGNVAGLANNSFGTSTAACSSGTLVGGGYTTSVSGPRRTRCASIRTSARR